MGECKGRRGGGDAAPHCRREKTGRCADAGASHHAHLVEPSEKLHGFARPAMPCRGHAGGRGHPGHGAGAFSCCRATGEEDATHSRALELPYLGFP